MRDHRDLPPLYVVFSTGRSGSTLLSDLLDMHPDILSVSEFLIGLLTAGIRHRDQPISVQEFCALLHTANPSRAALTRAGIELPENRYPFDQTNSRYAKGEIIPPLLFATLPMLTDDPDHLFDKLLLHIKKHGGRSAGAHLEAVFAFLVKNNPCSVIVERSGGALGFARQVNDLLPHARPVVLLRDGPSTVLSMNHHSFFRHVALRFAFFGRLGYDPFLRKQRDSSETLPGLLTQLLPENFNAEVFARFDPPLHILGNFWSSSIQKGEQVLCEPSSWFHFEDLCRDPAGFLTEIAAVLGVPAREDWLSKASGRVSSPRSRITNLTQDEREILLKSCQAGSDLLARLKDKA